jgi:hypothetical protein
MNEVDFERLAREYAASRDNLAEKVNDLESEIALLKKQGLPAIRRAAESAAMKEQALRDAIKAHPLMFIKPRTKVMHGIKFGYQKERGKLSWEDEERVVALIKKHFPEDLEFLVKTEEKPQKKALEKLSAADLKKLGIAVGDDQDVPVVRSMDSEIDKIVKLLLDTEEIQGPAEVNL